MSNLEKLNEMYIDVLREIGNIGTGNATTAISNMLNLKMDMSVPKVELMPVEKLGTAIGAEDEVVVGIMLGVEADIDGSMMFIMDERSAHRMVNLLMMRDFNDMSEFNEMDLSALMEIGNIIAGSYLSAISGLTNLTISPTVPSVSIDMAAAILSVPAIQFGLVSDRALMIKTEIGGDNQIDGYFILMPDEESFTKILSSLGISI